MEEKEYNEKLLQIEADYKKAKSDLHIQFAMANAEFKKGDIIRDHRWTILVESISVTIPFMEKLPVAVYKGSVLKKDLTPKVNGDKESLYGNGGIELVREA